LEIAVKAAIFVCSIDEVWRGAIRGGAASGRLCWVMSWR
jgi:hypothetical protein